jgi:hypothetical protein
MAVKARRRKRMVRFSPVMANMIFYKLYLINYLNYQNLFYIYLCNAADASEDGHSENNTRVDTGHV